MGKENYHPVDQVSLPTIDDYNENRHIDGKNISPSKYGSEKSTTDQSRIVEKRPELSYRDLITEVFKDNPYESFTRAEIIERIKNKYEYYRNRTNWVTTLKRRFNRGLNILFFRIEGTDVDDGRYVHRNYLPPNYRLLTFSDGEKLYMNVHQLDFQPQVRTMPVPPQEMITSDPFNHPANIPPSGFQGNTLPLQISSIKNQQFQNHNQMPLVNNPVFLTMSSGMSCDSLSSIHNSPHSQNFRQDQNFSRGPCALHNQGFQPAQHFVYGSNAPCNEHFQSGQHFLHDQNALYNPDFQSDQHFSYGPICPYSQVFQSLQNSSHGPSAYQHDFQSVKNLPYNPNFPYCLDFRSAQYFPNGSNPLYYQNFPYAQNKPCFQNCTPLDNYSLTRDVNNHDLIGNNPVSAEEIARGQNNPEIQSAPSPLSVTARNANVQSWLENHLSIKSTESHGMEEKKEKEDAATGFDKNATSLYFYSRENPISSGEYKAMDFIQRPVISQPGLLMITPRTHWDSKLCNQPC